MSEAYFEEHTYEGVDYTAKGLAQGRYEACSFVNCDFSNADLAHISFTECSFKGCNLSMVKVVDATFNDAVFRDCKMLGINFEHCNEYLFTVEFENCLLNFSSFYKRVLKKTSFRNCSLQEVDFIETDLSGSVLDLCDLTGARFENTTLDKVDFRTAYGFSINPEINKVKKAQFSLAGLPGLLTRFDIVITP
jgi:fluoroquinolone resistance protein